MENKEKVLQALRDAPAYIKIRNIAEETGLSSAGVWRILQPYKGKLIEPYSAGCGHTIWRKIPVSA